MLTISTQSTRNTPGVEEAKLKTLCNERDHSMGNHGPHSESVLESTIIGTFVLITVRLVVGNLGGSLRIQGFAGYRMLSGNENNSIFPYLKKICKVGEMKEG